jgi:hypothetical protein
VIRLYELEICHTESLYSYDYNDTFSVLAGPKGKCFTVHRAVLCSKSKFFTAACGERWKSGQGKIVRLPEVKSRVFQHYVDWAYGEILVLREDEDKTMSLLIELYLLGDRLDDIKLRNKTIKAMASCSYTDHVCPSPISISLVWDSTTPNSPLRNWIINEYLLRTGRAYFKNNLAKYPADFTQQIALKLMEQTPTVDRDVVQAKTAEYLEAEDGT